MLFGLAADSYKLSIPLPYMQTEMNGDVQDTESSVEAIRYFKPPNDKMSSTFRLMRVKGLQPWANTSSVSVGDVIKVTNHCLA